MSALHYIIAFSAFGLFVLTIMSGRAEKRQAQIEQRFHGIQEMQRRAGTKDGVGGRRPLKTPEERPLLISLRPIMLTLGVVMVVAWLMLVWRSVRQASGRDARPDAPRKESRNKEH